MSVGCERTWLRRFIDPHKFVDLLAGADGILAPPVQFVLSGLEEAQDLGNDQVAHVGASMSLKSTMEMLGPTKVQRQADVVPARCPCGDGWLHHLHQM